MSYDVDINNLPLNEEADFPAEIDPTVPYWSGYMPIEDGKHRAKLSISEKFPNVVADNDAQGKVRYYALRVNATVVEPGTPNDNKPARDFVSTMPTATGACRAVGVLVACGVEPTEIPRTQAGVIKKLYEVLQGQPMVEITTQWQALPREKDENGKRRKAILRGQRNFKEGKDGHRIPSVEDPITGEEITADAVITRYSPITD